MRIMWTGRGLGVELHTEGRFVFHPQAFQRLLQKLPDLGVTNFTVTQVTLPCILIYEWCSLLS